ncbi:MAG TPA: hypothetical protein VFM34_01585 [Moraxellaceae bacterium]|nr:hypothetical protein [Moraxellaceae bacterium]
MVLPLSQRLQVAVTYQDRQCTDVSSELPGPSLRPIRRIATGIFLLLPLALFSRFADAMSFGEYSSACADNGGSAYVDSSGIYQCGFSSGSSGGSGGSGSSGGGGRSAPAPAPNAANQMMLNVMQAASPYVQQAIHDALYGNPAEKAAREAERRRQAEEKARKDEATKARLLGESNEPGQMSMMGLQTNSASLQMMTGDDALQPMATSKPKQEARSDAYNRGHDDAARCGSANAGPYCSAATDTTTCVNDYNGGFQVGSQERKQHIVEAYEAGRQAGARNERANAAADARAEGECRIDWVQAYNQGYQETHAPANAVPASK